MSRHCVRCGNPVIADIDLHGIACLHCGGAEIYRQRDWEDLPLEEYDLGVIPNSISAVFIYEPTAKTKVELFLRKIGIR